MTADDLASGQLPVHNGIVYLLEGIKQDEIEKTVPVTGRHKGE